METPTNESPSSLPLNGGSPGLNGDTPAGAAPVEADWRTHLSEEVRGEKGWERFKSVDNLARSYRDLERRLGERAPTRPGAEATDQERAAWRQYLGVPESPQGYQVERPPSLPEGQNFDPGRQSAFLDLAHQLDLAPHQVQQLMNWEAEQVGAHQAQQEALAQEEAQRANEAGRQKWGQQQWDMKLALASEYLRRMGSPELREDLDTLIVRDGQGKPMLAGNHPGIIELLAEHAQLTGHAPYVIGEGGGILSQASARERLEAAYADHRAGKLTPEQLHQAVERYAPVAFG